MNLKSMISMEVIENNHTFFFYLPIGSKFDDAIIASQKMIKKIIEMRDKSEEKNKEEKEKEEKEKEGSSS